MWDDNKNHKISPVYQTNKKIRQNPFRKAQKANNKDY